MKQHTRVLALLLALVTALSFTTLAADALSVTATYDGKDLEGATVPAGGSITLVFSNNVTDASVKDANFSKIKVKNAEGADVSATPSVGADQKTIVVTLGSDLAKGAYTLNLGKEITAKNGLTLGSKVTYSFNVKGSGSGSGEGQDNPLEILQSNITDGDKDVDPNFAIVLYFSKNVVNVAVREKNQACFTVTDSKGAAFAIDVQMGNDETDPSDDVKRTVTIVPIKPYTAGETYTLKVSKDLAAKNGRDVLGEDVTITFMIAAAEEPAELSLLERIEQYIFGLITKILDTIGQALTKLNIGVPSWYFTIKAWLDGLFA